MRYGNTLLFFVFLLPHVLIVTLHGQGGSSKAAEYYRQAETALVNHKYQKARRLFEKSLFIQPELTAAHRGIGLCCELLNDFETAAFEYRTVIEADSMFSRVLYYQLAEAYYKTGKFSEALHYFKKYKALQALPSINFSISADGEKIMEEIFLKQLPSKIRAARISLDSLKFMNITEVVNLGNAINTKGDEYFPYLTNDQQQLYFTRLKDKDENLHKSHFENGRWSNSLPVRNFNTKNNEGMPTLVRNGRKLYFTACGREEVLGSCDIWVADVKGDDVVDPAPIAGFANSASWESEASINCDGSLLFFASNRPGGFGGSDLWYSKRQPDNSWGEPVNLGPDINTPGDEESPFITNDGKSLYFSSSGHPGMGEQDIFLSWWDAKLNNWGVPINLGPPVNTPFRELGFFLSADGKTGYFASDRTGGYGNMDIYSFELSEQLFSEPVTFVEGLVTDSGLGIPVKTQVLINGNNSLSSDEEGRFFLCVGANEVLDIEVNKKYYFPYHKQFAVPEWDNKSFYNIDIRLKYENSLLDEAGLEALKERKDSTDFKKGQKRSTYYHTLLFEFDEYKISSQELLKFDDFIQPYKSKKIERVEIIGFSDDIGSDAYNLKLSEERAKQIAMFLINNDIIVDQIYMEGRGELKEGSDTDKKRRVEVRVTVLE